MYIFHKINGVLLTRIYTLLLLLLIFDRIYFFLRIDVRSVVLLKIYLAQVKN